MILDVQIETVLTWVTLIISILTFLGFGTVIQMFIKDKHNKRVQNSIEAKEKAKKERQNEIREVIREEVAPLKEDLENVKVQINIGQKGTRAGLRNDILTCYYRCCEKGYRGDWDFENIHLLFDAYLNLNGNSFIKDVMERFKELPTKEEYAKGKRINKECVKLHDDL